LRRADWASVIGSANVGKICFIRQIEVQRCDEMFAEFRTPNLAR